MCVRAKFEPINGHKRGKMPWFRHDILFTLELIVVLLLTRLIVVLLLANNRTTISLVNNRTTISSRVNKISCRNQGIFPLLCPFMGSNLARTHKIVVSNVAGSSYCEVRSAYASFHTTQSCALAARQGGSRKNGENCLF